MKKTVITSVLLLLTAILLLSGRREERLVRITADGSTSAERVISTLGEAYELKKETVSVTYNPTGSSTGIKAVLEGRCDIGISSRSLKKSEISEGLEATVLAYDGIAVIVNRENPVSELTTEELRGIYTGEITNWRAAGGKDAPVVVVGREAGSGSRDGFEEMTGTSGKCIYRQELTSTGEVISSVSRTPGAIGYISLAAKGGEFRTLKINGAEPSEENILNNRYVLKRPFLLITKKGRALSPETEDFLSYVTSEEAGAVITAAGAVPGDGKKESRVK